MFHPLAVTKAITIKYQILFQICLFILFNYNKYYYPKAVDEIFI